MRSVAVSIMTVTAIKEKTKWSLLIQQGINDKGVASAGQHRVVLMTFLSLTASTEQKDIAGLGPNGEASMAGSGLKVFWGMFLHLALLQFKKS